MIKNLIKKVIIVLSLFCFQNSFAKEVTIDIGFLTEIDEFNALGIEQEDLARYIKEMKKIIETNKEIFVNDDDGVIFLVEVSGIANNKKICEKNYKDCSMIRTHVKPSETIDIKKLDKLTSNFLNLNEIKVKNNNIKNVGVFYIIVKKDKSIQET